MGIRSHTALLYFFFALADLTWAIPHLYQARVSWVVGERQKPGDFVGLALPLPG